MGSIPEIGTGAEVLTVLRSSRRNTCFALKHSVHLNSFPQRVVVYILIFKFLDRKQKDNRF
jgi:hypothetical protein